jgi:hypothetical protein
MYNPSFILMVIGNSSLSSYFSLYFAFLGLQISIAVLIVNKGDYSVPFPVESLPD